MIPLCGTDRCGSRLIGHHTCPCFTRLANLWTPKLWQIVRLPVYLVDCLVTLLARFWSTPDFSCYACHEFKLAALILKRYAVAFHSRCETTLRTESEPLERYYTRGLLNAVSQLIGRLQARFLGCDQTKHHIAIFGYIYDVKSGRLVEVPEAKRLADAASA